MVLALAGDSTMTRPLVNFPSVEIFLFSKLARIGGRQQVTASTLLASSSQFANQRGEHPLDFYDFQFKSLIIRGIQEIEISCQRQKQVIFQFAGGSHSDLKKPTQFAIALPATSLSICWLRLRRRIAAFDWSAHTLHLWEMPCCIGRCRESTREPSPRLLDF